MPFLGTRRGLSNVLMAQCEFGANDAIDEESTAHRFEQERRDSTAD